MSPVWNSYSQPRRIFGWTELLANWETTGVKSSYIAECQANLDQARELNLPLTHFITFVNSEEDALKWLVYECVSRSWLWGTPNVDYLRELVDLVTLDSGFSAFPGSPLSTMTVRGFLEENLNNSQLDTVSMMPGLISSNSWSAAPAPPGWNTWAYPAAPAAAPAPAPTCCYIGKHVPISFRVIHPGTSKDDDIIQITKNGDNNYSLNYTDQYARVKTATKDLNYTTLFQNLSTLLRLLTVDDEPSASLQMNLPNKPVVLFKIANLRSQIRDLIYDSVENVIANWPVYMPPPASE